MGAIKSLQSYWRRRTYQKLESLPGPTKKAAVVRLGGGGGQKISRRSCKTLVVVRRLKKLSAPKVQGRVMQRIRDGYVNFMLMFAGDSGGAAKNGGGGAVWDRRIPRAREGSVKGGDFEKRILVHLYNSVISTR